MTGSPAREYAKMTDTTPSVTSPTRPAPFSIHPSPTDIYHYYAYCVIFEVGNPEAHYYHRLYFTSPEKGYMRILQNLIHKKAKELSISPETKWSYRSLEIKRLP